MKLDRIIQYPVLLIAIGGAVGSALRYLIGRAIEENITSAFPLGTLFINVTGCLAIGFLAVALVGPWLVREEIRLAIMVGVLGGYTTFSSFGRETFVLISHSRMGAAAAYVLLSNILGLAAVWLGHRLGERLLTHS